MHHPKILKFTIGLLFLAYLMISTAVAGQISNHQLQSVLDEFRKQQNIVAASMALSFPDEPTPRLFFSGTHAQDSDLSLNVGSLSQVNSITKSFIATIALKLQEQGRLSLDDTLEYWLPEYPRWKQIRLRQLMNHTSGIFNYTDSKSMTEMALADPMHYFSAEALIEYAMKENDYFEPGQGWHYSNTNYVLLGQVIEKASNEKIDNLFNRLIKNDKLFLNNTSMVSHFVPSSIQTRLVHSYVWMSPTEIIDTTHFSMSWLNTAGNVISNTYDIVYWLRALFTNQLMSESSFAQFTQLVSEIDGRVIDTVIESNPDGYGLGIKASSSHYPHLGIIWWHSGGGLGYKSLMMWLPKQRIAIAIQYDRVDFNELNDPFSPRKEFPNKILQLINDNCE